MDLFEWKYKFVLDWQADMAKEQRSNKWSSKAIAMVPPTAAATAAAAAKVVVEEKQADWPDDEEELAACTTKMQLSHNINLNKIN